MGRLTVTGQQAALAEYLKHGGYDRHLRGFRQRLSEALGAMTNAVMAHFPAAAGLRGLRAVICFGWKCRSRLTHSTAAST